MLPSLLMFIGDSYNIVYITMHNPNNYQGNLSAYLAKCLKSRTYIGFTMDPSRRLRQHNGEITAGANRFDSQRWVGDGHAI